MPTASMPERSSARRFLFYERSCFDDDCAGQRVDVSKRNAVRP